MIKSSKLFSKRNRWIWFTIYSLYVVFILISATAFFAEETFNTRATGTFNYELTFQKNGKIEHYDVILENSEVPGKIWITYNADSHHLDIKTYNIKDLTIDCRSIAEEKTNEILGVNYVKNENEYKNYFIDKDLFTVSVETDQKLNLEFKDIPYPEKVKLNKNIDLSLGEDYSYSTGKIITSVPEGKTDVDIHFKSSAGENLNALFKTNDKDYFHIPDDTIEFDASESSETNNIVDYIWDFGDGSFDSGVTIDHTYSSPGIYDVTLVIRNSDGQISRITLPLYVFDEDNDGLPDDWEDKFVISNPTNDEDNDGLNNLQEYLRQTNPNKPDTDNDGASDGDEVKAQTNPLDPKSKPKITSEGEEDNGMLNMGKTGDIDNFLFIILIIIIVIIIVVLIVRKGGAGEEEEEAETTILETEEDIEELEEEEEAYECPDCGSPIFEDQSICTECGATLEWDEEGTEDEDEYEDEEEEYEDEEDEFEEDEILLADEKEGAPTTVTQVEEISDEDDDEEYECPTCGAALNEEDTVCPNCGEEFE